MSRKNHPGKHIEEVQYIKLNFLRYLFGNSKIQIFEDFPAKVLYTGTARAALRIILEYLTMKGVIANKNDEVLVPQWICQSVIHTMHKLCFPTLTVSKNLKGIMAYHQYGFPQNMAEICGYCEENNLFLIEDCANVYESYYDGRRLGTFGLAAIFSFSKLFPSILGGALTANDDGLYEFGQKRIKESNKWLSNLTYGGRLIWECLKDAPLEGSVAKLQEMIYAVTDYSLIIRDVSLRIVGKQLFNKAMERRKENYQFILRYFDHRPEYFNGLEREGVIPYVVPLFDKMENLEKMVKRLRERKVITDIYHFDVNRNLLNPNFEKCMWVPVHQGIDPDTLEMICETIKNT